MAVDREKIAEVDPEERDPGRERHPHARRARATRQTTRRTSTTRRRRSSCSRESKYAGDLPEITLAESGAGARSARRRKRSSSSGRTTSAIDVKIQQAESGTFFSDIDQGRYQMFHLGWIMDYPDPEDVLDVLFYSKSRQNNTRYSNPDVDAEARGGARRAGHGEAAAAVPGRREEADRRRRVDPDVLRHDARAREAVREELRPSRRWSSSASATSRSTPVA